MLESLYSCAHLKVCLILTIVLYVKQYNIKDHRFPLYYLIVVVCLTAARTLLERLEVKYMIS